MRPSGVHHHVLAGLHAHVGTSCPLSVLKQHARPICVVSDFGFAGSLVVHAACAAITCCV